MSRYTGSCGGFGGAVGKDSNCICSFPTLIILILIVLQFTKGDKKGHGGKGEDKQVSSGILFIVALFFLSCSGCGRG